MTRVMKTFPPNGNLISESIPQQRFDTETGGPVALMMRQDGWTVLSGDWYTIDVPRGGVLTLEWAEEEGA